MSAATTERVGITGYRLDISCPLCDRRLEHVTSGLPNITTTRATCRCRDCGAVFLVRVALEVVRRGCTPAQHAQLERNRQIRGQR